VNLERFFTSEAWKKTAILGWVMALAVTAKFVVSGTDPGAGMVTLTLGTLGISGFWQVGKRATHWRPTEEARAEQMRNGGELPGPGGGLAG
jgi:hypothetical protein